jgi:hypothetical protein
MDLPLGHIERDQFPELYLISRFLAAAVNAGEAFPDQRLDAASRDVGLVMCDEDIEAFTDMVLGNDVGYEWHGDDRSPGSSG